MASNTERLGLLKKDPVTDGADTFNLKTMINDNWDKIDKEVALIDPLTGKLKPGQIDAEGSGLVTEQEFQDLINVTKGQPNGIASLGPDGKVPAAELPKIANTGNDVTIDDAGNYFTGATVEDALQELGASINTARASMIASTNELMKG